MSSNNQNEFTKDNLDNYLKELAKEYRKLNGKSMPAEIILVGGAAIIANYGFRNMTTDIDAVITAASSMKDAINHVGDRNNLPNGWINSDFIKTASYSGKLVEYSVFYKTFSGIVDVRTIGAEYLIAMKLRSGRHYKNDLSDIIGILLEHENRGEPITLEKIYTAYLNLYGELDNMPEESRQFIEDIIANGNYVEAYTQTVENEKESRDVLIAFDSKYPGVVKQDNVNKIIQSLRKK